MIVLNVFLKRCFFLSVFFSFLTASAQNLELQYVSINPVSKGLDTTIVVISRDKLLVTDKKPDNERRQLTRRLIDIPARRVTWISDENKKVLVDKLGTKLNFEQLPGKQMIQGVECKAYYAEQAAVNPESKDTSFATTRIWVGEEVIFPALANDEALSDFGVYKGRLVYKMEYEWLFDYDKDNPINLTLTLMTKNDNALQSMELPAGYQTQMYSPQRFLDLFTVLEYGEMFRRLKDQGR